VAEPSKEWVRYNHLTNTYDTPDGTAVAAELVDSVQCLADVFYISSIREQQRAARAEPKP
jgi:hypothetical protein